MTSLPPDPPTDPGHDGQPAAWVPPPASSEPPSGDPVPSPSAPAGIPQAVWTTPPTAAPPANPGIGLLQAIGIAVAGAVVAGLVEGYTHFITAWIAVLIGGGVGNVVLRHAPGRGSRLAPAAAALTVVAVLVGHVFGFLEAEARFNHQSFHQAAAVFGYAGTLTHHTNGFLWLFAGIGGFVAFRRASGQLGRGPGRRRMF